MNIKDVAKKAEVSIATVSRVMSENTFVKEATRQKVINAIEELGYSPNPLAQALISKKSRTVGLILPNLSIPYFADIVHGVEQEAKRSGYALYICNTNYSYKKEEERIRDLITHYADGVIFASGMKNTLTRQILEQSGKEAVFINREIDGGQFDCFYNDNYEGTKKAFNYLFGLGHRQIGVLAGDAETEENNLKLNGCLSSYREGGFLFNEELVYYCKNNVSEGFKGTHHILSKFKVTAIVAFSDALAVGGISASRERGLSIPKNISFIGYNNTNFARYFYPTLTSVDVKTAELGKMACKRLIRKINSKTKIRPIKKAIEVELIIRESTGPAS